MRIPLPKKTEQIHEDRSKYNRRRETMDETFNTNMKESILRKTQLETQFNESTKNLPDLEDLTEEQLRVIYAYEQWLDGMEWSDAQDIWDGTNKLPREEMIGTLRSAFDYK